MVPPLRVVSYNVRYFAHALKGLASTSRSKAGIAAGLARLDPVPDVLCLQEVETVSLRSKLAFRERPSTETQLESFMGALETAFVIMGKRFTYEAFYFRAHSYRIRGTTLYTTGLAVVVNTDRLQVVGHNVDNPKHITHHHVQMLKDKKQSRICAHVTLTDQGKRFHVFNTHLSLPTPFTRAFWASRARMGFGVNQVHEARALCGFVRHHAGADPFIVTGDFNSPPGSLVYELLRTECGLVGAHEALGLVSKESPYAFPTAGFLRLRMHLDHSFCGNGASWVDLEDTHPFGVGPFRGLSDHMPVIGRVLLR